jgi:glutaredoxin/thiol-disulfide isomerase/thioredoxin
MPKVLVYTVDKCTYCAEVKAFLKENGLEYEEKALSDKKVWAEMQKKAMGCCKAEVKAYGNPAKVLVLAPQIFVDDKWAGTHRKAGEFGKLTASINKAAGKQVIVPPVDESYKDLSVLVYTVDKCTYCAEVKAFLKEKGINYTEKALSDKKVWAEMQKKAMGCCKAEVKAYGNPAKVLVLAPQIFVNDKWAGTHRKAGEFGKLTAELDKAAGKAVAPWTEDAADEAHKEGGIDDEDECNKCPSGEFHFEDSDEGSVEVLEGDTFDEVTSTGFWITEFYAPWCQHCAKLAPIYAEASDSEGISGFMKMGKVDATQHKDLAATMGVTGFPRLFWRRDGGEHHAYLGNKKTVKDFQDFAARMKKPAVLDAEPTATADEPVFFHLTLAAGDKDGALSTAFRSVAGSMQDQLFFSSTSGASTAVTRVQHGDDTRNDNYKGEATAEALNAWVTDNRFADLITLGKKNFKAVSKNYRGGLVVVGVYDPKDAAATEAFVGKLKGLSSYDSTSLSAAAKTKVAVGMLDGVEWLKYINTFGVGVSDFPAVFILENGKDRSYFKKGLTTAAEYVQFVEDVVAGKVSPKYGSVSKLYDTEGVPGVIMAYPWIILAVIGVLFILHSLVTVAFGEDDGEEDGEEEEEGETKKGK